MALTPPFFPLRSYFETDLPVANPLIRPVQSPYGDGTVYAVPPLKPDVAIVHAQRASASGDTQMMAAVPTAVAPQVKQGRLKYLAVTSRQRYSLLPDVPTVAESGYPGFDAPAWWALLAPAKTPAAVITKLNAAVAKADADAKAAEEQAQAEAEAAAVGEQG